MIIVLDIGIGNIGSVCNVLKFLRFDFEVVEENRAIPDKATKIIFPGVGSYFEAAKRLKSSSITPSLKDKVLNKKIPILGICLGMQLLTKKGYEHGEAEGLGFIDAEVKKIVLENRNLVLPHIGWNDVHYIDNSMLFSKIDNGSCFYFVHSYECVINDKNDLFIGYTDYGRDIVASFAKGNIYGVQFHPEKSQKVGLQMIKNFIELC